MSKPDDDTNWLGLLVMAGLILWGGYAWGTSSKQPYIDSLNSQVSAKDVQIKNLNVQYSSLQSKYDTATLTPLSGPYVAPTLQDDNTTCPITTCSDGWCSSSTGRGTCSSHGGIAY